MEAIQNELIRSNEMLSTPRLAMIDFGVAVQKNRHER
jgi:hypothetical protein